MIQWARFASKATKLGKKAKKGAKKVYKKNPIFNKSDVGFIKQYPWLAAGAAGVGLVAGAGISGLASGAYNLATGKRNVKVDKKTAAQIKIKKIKKQYNI